MESIIEQRFVASGSNYAQRSDERRTIPSGASSGVSFHEGAGHGRVEEISAMSLQDMRRVSQQLCCDTSWLRVVHSGYGQDVWKVELQKQGLTVLHSQSHAEGAYVRVPDERTPEDLVKTLIEINRSVRRRFQDMPRANKSRVHFKFEPIIVSPNSDQVPGLVRTSRFVVSDSGSTKTISGGSNGVDGSCHSDNGGRVQGNKQNNSIEHGDVGDRRIFHL